MATASYEWENARDSLARFILSVIRQWTELDRRMFVAAHYRGQTPDQIAAAYGLREVEVRHILEQCERKLHEALRGYRHSGPSFSAGSQNNIMESTLNSVSR